MDLQLVVTIDGLSSHVLGPYGNHWIPTPFCNQLAASGTVFDFFFAESDDCQANLHAMVSGHHVLGSADTTPTFPAPILPGDSCRWNLLVTDDNELDPTITNLFETVATVDPSEEEILGDQYESLFGFSCAQLESIISQKTGSQPLRVWIHSQGLFAPWNTPLEIQNLFKDDSDPEPVQFEQPPAKVLDSDFDPDERLTVLHAYAAEVVQIDQGLANFFEAISVLMPESSIDLAVAGVRGFALGEHLEVGDCGKSFHAEKLQIPLIRYTEDQIPVRENHLISSHQFQSSLMPGDIQRHASEQDKSVVVSVCEGFWRIQTRAWSYIHPVAGTEIDREAKGQLFAKPGDSLEVNEVSEVCPQIAIAMRDELARQIAVYQSGETPQPSEPNSEIFEYAS